MYIVVRVGGKGRAQLYNFLNGPRCVAAPLPSASCLWILAVIILDESKLMLRGGRLCRPSFVSIGRKKTHTQGEKWKKESHFPFPFYKLIGPVGHLGFLMQSRRLILPEVGP